MTKWENIKAQVLFQCKRYCCKCENYYGLNLEVHHIKPKAKGGGDTFDNAIPLCFNCHAEIGSYNPSHPKGNKYSVKELKLIRDNWYTKAEPLSHSDNTLSNSDKQLLTQFENNTLNILEYIIDTDISNEYVDITLGDSIQGIIRFWRRKSNKFTNQSLESLKVDILNELAEYLSYLTNDYLRFHPSGNLIFKNSSTEEGIKLREELRPNTRRIRQNILKLYRSLDIY